MIFAREVSDGLTSLVKKIDAETAKHADAGMGSFVVFCTNESDELVARLKALAKKEGLKHTVLSIDSVPGPEGFEVAKDADVTVVLYHKHVVKANHAFKKGELNAAATEKIVADIAKILPEKKAKK